MKELSCSYRYGCLSCSFSDKELSAFLQYLKRKHPSLPKKYAVASVGKQPDGTWVLGKNAYFTSNGEPLTISASDYLFIGDLYEGKGVATESQQCIINMPISIDPLRLLLGKLKFCMKHNYYPTLLTIASTVMAMHYRRFIQNLSNCPIPIAFGGCGSGKTTALKCSLALLGAHTTRFFREISAPKIAEMCSVTDIPLGVDDPDSKSGLHKVIMDLFNGAKRGTVGKGETQPTSTVVISSNFTPHEQQRYNAHTNHSTNMIFLSCYSLCSCYNFLGMHPDA